MGEEETEQKSDGKSLFIILKKSSTLSVAPADNFGKKKKPSREDYQDAPVRALTIQSHRRALRTNELAPPHCYPRG
jgi:hypothetical protein